VTLFEYIAIAFSMVLSFMVLRILSVIPHAIQTEKRYWVYLIWIANTLATVFLLFWSFWWFRDVDWNIVSVILILASPGILYVYVSLLVPDNAADVKSWRDHFYLVRFRLFLTSIVWVVVAIFGGHFIAPAESIELVMAVALIIINSIGAASSKPAVHAVLVLIPSVIILIVSLLVYFQPMQ
jgi:hypothetical protein